MALKNALTSGQSDPEARRFCTVQTLEWRKNEFLIFGWNTNAIVSHADPPKSLRLAYIGYLHGIDVDELCGDRYKRIDAFPFVFYGIQKNVGKDLAHLMRNYRHFGQI